MIFWFGSRHNSRIRRFSCHLKYLLVVKLNKVSKRLKIFFNLLQNDIKVMLSSVSVLKVFIFFVECKRQRVISMKLSIKNSVPTSFFICGSA